MSHFFPRWMHIGRGLAAAALLAFAFGSEPAGAQADTLTNPKHFFWANGQASPTGTVASTPGRAHRPRARRGPRLGFSSI